MASVQNGWSLERGQGQEKKGLTQFDRSAMLNKEALQERPDQTTFITLYLLMIEVRLDPRGMSPESGVISC